MVDLREKTIRKRPYLAFPCPECGVKAFELCITGTGNVLYVSHRTRVSPGLTPENVVRSQYGSRYTFVCSSEDMTFLMRMTADSLEEAYSLAEARAVKPLTVHAVFSGHLSTLQV